MTAVVNRGMTIRLLFLAPRRKC